MENGAIPAQDKDNIAMRLNDGGCRRSGGAHYITVRFAICRDNL